MCNVVDTEVKEIKYLEGRQYFNEKNLTTGEVKSTFFKTKEKNEKVIHNKNATIVILDDGCKGVAKCSPEDEFNKTTGIKIAYLRAKIKSLQKELKYLLTNY
jgi:hypothetical protein